jgi:sarcosine oxidase subunit beta
VSGAIAATSRGPLREHAEIVIVGGGVMGLSIAYQLARRGLTDVVVIERGYLAEGASGRNGGGVRMQWSSELNVRLMKRSIELCSRIAQELGLNVWFRQGGYLFLGRSGRERASMEKNVALQNRCGVPTRMLDPVEAKKIVPQLSLDGVVCAAYNHEDGVLFPWPFLWGYATQAMRRGVEVHLHTPVTAIERAASEWLVRTPKGAVRTPRLINAAGAWSPEVSALAGQTLPNRPHRHEILSTEPLKPFLTPMVSLLSSGLYFSQSARGEIVTGVTYPDAAGDADGEVHMGSRLGFLGHLAREILTVMPRLGDVKVLRQWAGPYDMSPDGHPILGDADDAPGLYLCCGFAGYGFMMAPVIGELYAEWLTGGARHEVFDRCKLSRFADGEVAREEMLLG